jgi:hypothetical protein
MQVGRLAADARATACWQSPQQCGKVETLSQAALLPNQVVSQINSSLNVAFNIEVVVDVGFAQCQFAWHQKHSPQSSGMLETENKPRLLLRPPNAPVPQAHLKVAGRVPAQQIFEKLHAERASRVKQ